MFWELLRHQNIPQVNISPAVFDATTPEHLFVPAWRCHFNHWRILSVIYIDNFPFHLLVNTYNNLTNTFELILLECLSLREGDYFNQKKNTGLKYQQNDKSHPSWPMNDNDETILRDLLLQKWVNTVRNIRNRPTTVTVFHLSRSLVLNNTIHLVCVKNVARVLATLSLGWVETLGSGWLRSLDGYGEAEGVS